MSEQVESFVVQERERRPQTRWGIYDPEWGHWMSTAARLDSERLWTWGDDVAAFATEQAARERLAELRLWRALRDATEAD